MVRDKAYLDALRENGVTMGKKEQEEERKDVKQVLA